MIFHKRRYIDIRLLYVVTLRYRTLEKVNISGRPVRIKTLVVPRGTPNIMLVISLCECLIVILKILKVNRGEKSRGDI